MLLLHSQFTLQTANNAQLYEFTIYRLPFALAANLACLQNYEKGIKMRFQIVSFVNRISAKDRGIEYSTIRRESGSALKKNEKKFE